MIEQLAMFSFDIASVCVLLLVALFWKEQQTPLIVGSFVYLFFTIVWHFPPGIITY
jgi:hypothetical protein|tara:strand:- start:986 stop:1153 length:168 start_codon:yes stop_codon:yes gene_type:complete